ncbi:MAG TPA: glycosyltransferase family 4 protein [Armatimonadota bacterium]|nr:glycosyltransferase family 4 protein [Armatimonadota bacterium]
MANTTAYPHIGGVENSLLYLGHELQRLGHEVAIFCLQTSPADPAETAYQGIPILRTPLQRARWGPRGQQLRILAARQGIAQVRARFPADAVWARSASMALGIAQSSFPGPVAAILPTVVHMNCHGLYFNTTGNPPLRRAFLWLTGLFMLHAEAAMERAVLRHCTPIVFSALMQRQLRRAFGAVAERVRVIPPGVDSDIFSPAHGQALAPQITAQYGLTADEPWVLYVGRLSVAKNVPLLLQALRLTPDTRLVLVGDGKERARLTRQATALGMQKRVRFVGRQHEVLPGFYAMARATVLPTTHESFGQVYLESLACGTPVIGFAADDRRVLTATQEIVRHGETGLVVDTVTPEALAGAIDTLMAMAAGDYAAMAARAVADVRARFSWRAFVETLLAVTAASAAKVVP